MLQGRPSPSSTSHSRPKAPSATTTPRSTLLAISTCEQHDDHHIKLIANLISGTFFSEFLTLTHTGRRSRCTGAARLLWRRGRLLRRVRKTHISFVLKMLFVLKMISFYQDRLGTSIGKAKLTKREWRFSQGGRHFSTHLITPHMSR